MSDLHRVLNMDTIRLKFQPRVHRTASDFKSISCGREGILVGFQLPWGVLYNILQATATTLMLPMMIITF